MARRTQSQRSERVRRRRSLARMAAALAVLWGPDRAAAVESPAAASAPLDREAAPGPWHSRALDPDALAEKREGVYVTAVPLVNYDPDTGVGLGARVYRYWNGTRTDPLFAATPYLRRVYAQAFVTTAGYQFHALDLDAPYVDGSPFRVRAALAFERNVAANYFGRGASTLGPLTFPGSPSAFSRIDEYRAALAALQPDGTTYARYDRYFLTRPAARASIERDLFGGPLRLMAGFAASYIAFRDFTGEAVPATSTAGAAVTAPEATTRLRADCIANRVTGCTDGWSNDLRLGIAYDTRDSEPDPTSGALVDLTAEFSSRVLGSAHDYGRISISPRLYWMPWRGGHRLVVAARALYSVQTGDIPFYDMSTLALSDGDIAGVGGLRTLRGYSQDRFVGRVAAVTTLELRWTLHRFVVGDQRFQVMTVPFLDLGRIFDRVQDTSFLDWKRGQGAALRVAWNQATIISADLGFSSESTSIYVDFGHQF